jgi:iron complex outermembrane receptor protein
VPLSSAPAVGSVLTRDQIDDYGWNSLNELLWSQPGFFRGREFERRIVGISGVSEDWNNNRLLLLIDGLPANHVETGTAFTMEQTPLFMIRRAEVLRGPGSALYGSFALSGVVSLQHQTWHYGTGHGWLFWAPDGREDMREHRQLLSLRWAPPRQDAWRYELALQYQRYGYRLDTRHYPAGAFDGYYPDGVSELIATDTDSLFARTQIKRTLPKRASLLATVEYTGTLYNGDGEHSANADLLDPDAPPVEGGVTLGPIYEPIDGRIVSKLGALVQLESGELLGDAWRVTAGLRWDGLFFRYEQLAEPGTPVVSGSFQDLSPRLALIWQATSSLTLKLMAARAFRTPNIVELFAANTFTAGGSDIASMRAERQDTLEVAADWSPIKAIRVRGHGWVARLADKIGYRSDEELIINKKDDVRVGGTLEALFETKLGKAQLDGFASYSLTLLVDETLYDDGLVESDRLTSAPSHLAKAGGRLRIGRLTLTLDGMVQGSVNRRDNELATEEFRALRPDTLPAWVTLNAAIRLQLTPWARVGLNVNNLFDGAGRLTTLRDAPFDYRVDARRVTAEILLTL